MRIVAGDADHPTLVNVVTGQAQVSGADLSLDVGPGQTARITGTDSYEGRLGPLASDPFLTAHIAPPPPPPQHAAPPPPLGWPR